MIIQEKMFLSSLVNGATLSQNGINLQKRVWGSQSIFSLVTP